MANTVIAAYSSTEYRYSTKYTSRRPSVYASGWAQLQLVFVLRGALFPFWAEPCDREAHETAARAEVISQASRVLPRDWGLQSADSIRSAIREVAIAMVHTGGQVRAGSRADARLTRGHCFIRCARPKSWPPPEVLLLLLQICSLLYSFSILVYSIAFYKEHIVLYKFEYHMYS